MSWTFLSDVLNVIVFYKKKRPGSLNMRPTPSNTARTLFWLRDSAGLTSVYPFPRWAAVSAHCCCFMGLWCFLQIPFWGFIVELEGSKTCFWWCLPDWHEYLSLLSRGLRANSGGAGCFKRSFYKQPLCVCLFPTFKHVQATSILEHLAGKEDFRKLPYDSLIFRYQIFNTSALFIKWLDRVPILATWNVPCHQAEKTHVF